MFPSASLHFPSGRRSSIPCNLNLSPSLLFIGSDKKLWQIATAKERQPPSLPGEIDNTKTRASLLHHSDHQDQTEP
ncbi:hypothetical protein H5410_015355 [Solanum commersonii]|uniref:Uncharacterized protein n=1 Tax=Solanum commersonii TaxID=4109 RepID=A0A9J5ZTV3_SOLCO|nr:hypothetical protein H5410_015355 [Solanum commersonii]